MSSSPRPVRRRALLGLAGALLIALVVGLVVAQQQRAREQRLDTAASAAAEQFARAAEGRDLTAVAFVGVASAAVQEQYAAVVEGLGTAPPEVAVTGVAREGDRATADLAWSWPVGADRWTYDTQLPLTAPAGEDAPWEVRFAPLVVHPELEPDGVLDASRTRAERADVLGRDGTSIVTPTPVVEVGVQPSRATDPAALSRALAGLLDVDAAALEQRIAAAGPDAFVPVITLRRGDYGPLRAQLQPLAGTVFREDTLPLAPTRAFARALLGTAGPVTAELVEQSEGRLAAGDVTGLSGLQRTYDERLSGTAGVLVEQVQGDERTELFSVAPVPGERVQVTLHPAVQQAADAALATVVGRNASLVAVDVATGDVVAVANTPLGGADRATRGQYPPGSTFKAVSTLALLATGLTPQEIVSCPPTATVDGRSFRNFEGSALGQVPFRTAFAQSCNTAFVGRSDRLEPTALPDAASTVGLGVPWQVGVDVFAGDVPAPQTPVDLAASTIGQGRTLVSPAAMAQVAATIARGSWAPPRLVIEPDAGAPAPPAEAADPARLSVVRDLMRQVVLDGTASGLGDVPGEPVHAKTGTAEFGTEQPPRTHAWTIGFRGPLAFAVIVEDGASGGAVAVPVVEAFLRGL